MSEPHALQGTEPLRIKIVRLIFIMQCTNRVKYRLYYTQKQEGTQ